MVMALVCHIDHSIGDLLLSAGSGVDLIESFWMSSTACCDKSFYEFAMRQLDCFDARLYFASDLDLRGHRSQCINE